MAKDPKMYQQIPFRLHLNDHRDFKDRLKLDGLGIQGFVEALVHAYLTGDQHIRDVARGYKQRNTVKKAEFTFSARERERVLDEIEDSET